MKTKIIILLLLAFSFQGCMLALSHSCESANSLLVWGGVDGKKDLVGKYELAYVFDRDTVHMDYKDYSSFNSNEERDAQYIHKAFMNVLLREPDLGCGYPLRGKHQIKTFLRNKTDGDTISLAERSVDMAEGPITVLVTQVHFGNKRPYYKRRKGMNIDWEKMKRIVINDGDDTLYHYTAKYKVLDPNWNYEEDEMIEVPEE